MRSLDDCTESDIPYCIDTAGRRPSAVSRYKAFPHACLHERGSLYPTLGSILFCLLLVILVGSCSGRKERIFRKSSIIMDTLVSVSVVSDSEQRAESAIDRAFGEIGKLDRLLNAYSGESEVTRINSSAGVSEVAVSRETLEVVGRALAVAEKTGGAFDITIGAESTLWDFAAKRRPDDEAIRDRMRFVGYRKVSVNRENSSVRLAEKGMLLDLGAIAKGYAADRAVAVLKESGISSGLVTVAGDIKAFGRKNDGSPWKVGIRNPRFTSKDDEIMATVELSDMAISTSGDYERYFIEGDRRYHHILDPKTGYPAMRCRSVSVMAKEGVDTDSFSTAVFVLGPEKGVMLLNEMGFEGVIIDSTGSIHTTPGLRGKIEVQGNR